MAQDATTLFSEYGGYHTDPRNRVCHEIGIPLIVLAVLALLRLVTFGPGVANVGALAALATAAYYFRIVRGSPDGAAAPAAALGLLLLYLAAAYVSWPLALGVFLAGWIFQFVGHAYEGKKPAFLQNAVHLLVGPLWIAHLIVRPRPS